ncbi:RNA binding domain-containing protein [Monocercomonoides exilis]|uniref:RNA binding domain-containing protein n=1 Tax=Monocercomonoides exilis TaxID=2049356 RepID=UPI003559A5BD|nr:RNA binding domain-containing protein [Monocercomonoides exilis]|eukprot:MONOS_14631.1-p1 / transcript=MONOS_14631.1 / gene=MONOS_14631 / organism=Monocercomonoides_exilis_PA203 / gene_product=unspecified product / transcript_product=unspecified product / location=Mono_scaffold01037:15185-16333(+) / protein_length=253 / sequence_SO=supercontig / SO=protein_coding / is_pseudo=false
MSLNLNVSLDEAIQKRRSEKRQLRPMRGGRRAQGGRRQARQVAAQPTTLMIPSSDGRGVQYVQVIAAPTTQPAFGGKGASTRFSRGGGRQRLNRFDPLAMDTNASWKAPQRGSQRMGRGKDFAPSVPKQSGSKVLVHNLHYEVNETQLKDVFSRQGGISSCKIEYDASGRSTGEAEVIFMKRSDAEECVKNLTAYKFQNQPITLDLAVDVSGRAPRGGRGGSKGRRGGSSGDVERLQHSAEELDAMLARYKSQ